MQQPQRVNYVTLCLVWSAPGLIDTVGNDRKRVSMTRLKNSSVERKRVYVRVSVFAFCYRRGACWGFSVGTTCCPPAVAMKLLSRWHRDHVWVPGTRYRSTEIVVVWYRYRDDGAPSVVKRFSLDLT